MVMRVAYCSVVFVGLLLLCSGAAADVHLNSSSPWLVAGSGNTSTIFVTGAAPNSFVNLSVSYAGADDSTLDPLQVTTDDSGNATATFYAGTKSGAVTITAEGTTEEVVQNVDHAAPYKLAFKDYTSEATVGSEMPIVLAMEDRYGNRIDNRWETATGGDVETITFSVGSPDDSAVFVESGGDTAVCPVDENGNVTATLKLSRKAGENIVFVDFPDPIADEYLTFYGLSTAPPASITCTISAQGDDPLPWVPADGKSTFNFTCTLKDADGNPSVNQSLNIATSLSGEEAVTLRSNAEGQVLFTYGPKDTTGKVTITMTAAVNSSVTCSRTVEFTSTAPVDMLLTASPQTMPSSDVNPDQTAEIRAKVVDIKGNPVAGENVTFSISSATIMGCNATTDVLKPPYLVGKSGENTNETSAVTNKNGSAIVYFRPGAFVQDGKNSATGICNVTAVWGDDAEPPLLLTWKNYPYLSVSTSVDKEVVNLTKENETDTGLVNVTITLKGDGYALRPDPIDAVLAIDRSGSMMEDNPDRMVKTMGAAKTFVEKMSLRDHIGLVSFGTKGKAEAKTYYSTSGWLGPGIDNSDRDDDQYVESHYPGASGEPAGQHTYSNYATVDCHLTDELDTVNNTIDTLIPYSGTPMRAGLYEAIKEVGTGDSKVKAVILLSDGDYNWYGDPLARGSAAGYWDKKWVWDGSWYYESVWVPTKVPKDFNDLTSQYYRFTDLSDDEQDLSVYAQSKSVKIYSIAFANDISAGGKATLQKLAESTGGKYYYAPSGDDLAAIYTAIAGELKTEAGVNTTMGVSFKNVKVNGTLVPGDEVFAYQHNSNSTFINSWIDNQTPSYVPFHYPSYPYIEDQTHNWDQNKTLSFDIGTVHLNQTWTTTYTLKVLKDGNINIFGPGSVISFDNGNETLDLPDTYITATHLNNSGINTSSYLWVSRPVQVGNITDMLRLKWKLNYTGNDTAAQRLSYSPDDRKTWIPFQTSIALEPRTSGKKDESTVLDVSDFQPGRYWVRVSATAPDAPPAQNETLTSIQIGNTVKAKIKLQ